MRLGFLLFPFSGADQGRIVAASLAVTDVAFAAAPAAGAPYPQALRMAFQLTAATPIPQVRALFPGQMRFIPDPAAPGVTPAPADVAFTATAYSGWRTRGTLRIAIDVAAAKALAPLAAGLEAIPNVIWYGPVRISQDFLFTTLRTGLRKDRIGGTPAIPPTASNWAQHAVAGFLQGTYEPVLRPGTSPATDDRIRFAMPTVDPTGPQHDVTLHVTTALRQKPMDGKPQRFDDLSVGVDRDDPAHAVNGAVPARHFHRVVRAHLTDGPAGAVVPDAVLGSAGSTPVYHALRFTRPWKAVADCSVEFPEQQVVVRDSGGATLATQRLPAHGVFFWSFPSNAPVRSIQVAITGGMRWIDGATADVWRQQAGTAPLVLDLAATPSPHIQLRLPMSRAMLVEPRDNPGANRCTYLSLRRSVRALVDNRICGGRLNFGRGLTSAPTRLLIDDAWTAAPATPATSADVRDSRPLPNLEPAVGNPRLIPPLRAFFPAIVPAQNIGGSTARTASYDLGTVAYYLWQINRDELHDNGTKRNFPPAHVGRGSAGALNATGLAAAYHSDPSRNPGESDNAYFDRIVGLLETGLQPGAVLQFWALDTDFEGLKGLQTAAVKHPMGSYGHSPIFQEYVRVGGVVTALKVIDQTGTNDCQITGPPGNRRIDWISGEQIWLAANWSE